MPLQKRVDQLPAVTGVTGPDLIILSRTTGPGVGTRRVRLDQIAAYLEEASGQSEAYVQANAPATANAGASWFDTDNGRLYVRYEGVWVEV
jgi:hypothetical protein